MNVVSNNTTVKAFALPFRVRRYKFNDRLSLDFARRQGYTVTIFGDGYGTVDQVRSGHTTSCEAEGNEE